MTTHIQPLFRKLFKEATGLSTVSDYISKDVDYVALFKYEGSVSVYFILDGTLTSPLQQSYLNIFDREGYKGEGGIAYKLDIFCNRYLTLLCKDNQIRLIETINNHFGISNDTDKVIIWPSNKIPYAYLENNYWQLCGTIGSSCMRHKANQKALNFYVKNNVKIAVIITKDSKVKARALLWENVSVKDRVKSITYLDRVYYSLGEQISLFNSFAIDNKFKSYSNNHPNLYIKNVNLDNITYLPYADTFKNLFYKDKVLTMESCQPTDIKSPSCKIRLSQVGNNGYFKELDPNAVKECLTNNYISKKDAIKVKKYNGYIAKDNIIIIDNIYYSRHDKDLYALTEDSYCLRVNLIKEVVTDRNIDKTKAIYLSKYDGYISKENIVFIKKEPYHKEDNKIVCFQEEFYLKSQCYHCVEIDVYIPKTKALILYDLTLDEEGNSVFGKTQYVSDTAEFYQLASGEGIRKTPENKEHLIRRNKKFYIKTDYQYKDKKQLLFNFTGVIYE